MSYANILRLNTTFTWQSIKKAALTGTTAIVIDVLRATTSTNAALANGAKTVIPCMTPEEAREHKKSLPECLLCGETNGYRIEGFDIGNSPLEYAKSVIAGKTVILSTSNGTKALQTAAAADHVLAGCINNAAAVAKSAFSKTKSINIIASGTLGEISYDDILAAGVIIKELLKLHPEYELNDASIIAKTIADNTKDLKTGLLISEHGRLLTELGFIHDIEYAARLNTCPSVGVYANGAINIEA